MTESGEMTATTAMTYRLQGAVVALDAVLGHKTTPFDWLEAQRQVPCPVA